jgi:hypothetical protein
VLALHFPRDTSAQRVAQAIYRWVVHRDDGDIAV